MQRLKLNSIETLASDLGVSAERVEQTIRYIGISHIATVKGSRLFGPDHSRLIRRVIREQLRDAAQAEQQLAAIDAASAESNTRGAGNAAAAA